MADLSKITLPNGTTYDLKDVTARNGNPSPATATPSSVGTAAVGTSAKYAREDHVHNISLATGDSNGQVKIAGTNVSVKGWNTAATYDVESTVANDSKLPTGAAVKSFVEGKGYITTDTNNRRAFYGTCASAAGTKDKVVTLADSAGWELLPGTIVGVKFTYTNTYSSATANPITLNVNSTGAKNIWYNTTHSGAGNTGTNTTIYGYANRYTFYMYDGTYWVWIHNDVISNSNTVPSAQCETGAGTAAKAATCTNYTLTANTYLHFNIRYTNTSAGVLTMNVNSKGAKTIYINGKVSSDSNHTLPAGSYIAFYDGTNWYFRTDGKIPGVGPYNEGLKLDKTGTTDCSPVLSSNTSNISLAEGTYVVASSCTISSQIVFAQGATLSIPTGVTVTIKGEITAGRYQIFDGEGSLVITNNVIYPEWFGAKNDGTTDSYEGIMKAFAAVQSGGEVSFAGGTAGGRDDTTGKWSASARCYKISQAVQLDKARVKLSGEGGHAVICSETAKVITIGSTTRTSRIEQVQMVDFYLFSLITPPESPSISTESQFAITIAWTESSKFEKIRVTGNSCCFWLQGNSGAYLDRCKCTPATNNKSLTGCGYRLECTPRNWSNYMVGCSASMGGNSSSNFYGVYVAGSDTADLFFEHCEFVNCTTGVSYTSNASGTGIDVTFRGCTFDQISNRIVGLYLNKANGNIRFDTCYLQVDNNHAEGAVFITGGNKSSTHFVNCWFADADKTNYTLRTAEIVDDHQLILTDCTFARAASHAISIGADGGHAVVTNCVFRNESGTVNYGVLSPIINNICTTANAVTLIGNLFQNQNSEYFSYGIDNTAANTLAIGNVFTGNFRKNYNNSPSLSVNSQDNDIVPVRTVHSSTDALYSESYKYADGRLIINMRSTITISISTASGGIYTGTVSAIDWPIAFTAKPTCVYSTEGSSSNAFVWGQNAATASKTPALYAGRGTSNTSTKFTVTYHAEGRWK